MDTTLRFDRVHIVEWLRPGDSRTGCELFRQLEPVGMASKPTVSVHYWRASTRSEFIDLLRSFAADAREHGHSPVLHLETHGNSYGIGLSDKDQLLWPEFMSELIALNQAMKLNLFVSLAACEGAWGLQMLQPVGRAAFRVLIGPNREVSEIEIMNASVTFFQAMFQDQSAVTAFRAMNDAIDPASRTFGVVTAETAFRWVYREYLRQRCTDEELAEREDKIIAGMVARERVERGRGSSIEELSRARILVREHLRSHRHHFDETRKQFFFIDLFPENDARFNVTFEECTRVEAADAKSAASGRLSES